MSPIAIQDILRCELQNILDTIIDNLAKIN